MESSLNSSKNKAISSKGKTRVDNCPEESGWTIYFEDFLSNNQETTSRSSGFVSSSLVSDAASCAARKKFSDQDGGSVGCYSLVGSQKSCKELSFKKRMRTKGVWDDDDLEDTASSPVNSPKVSNLKQLDLNQRKKDDPLERFK
ncbi:PREDICTED: uncharacterized protein LOC104610871 isoform X2 [Nelumbo nucifera]|nr:PREDICTED: uncharacterized protein LOC104610871 isoform X2 [Nelumbo nucifera]